jgi:hypothetical protein
MIFADLTVYLLTNNDFTNTIKCNDILYEIREFFFTLHKTYWKQ